MITVQKLSIRDEFAMNAMRTFTRSYKVGLTEQQLVAKAYRVADLMLEK